MSWEKVRIKDFAEVITGGTPSTSKKEYWNNGDIPWLNSGELNQGLILSSSNFITKSGLENSAAKLMPPNTVLIALTGATTGVTGYLGIEACANQSVTGVIPSDKHHPKFLYYYLGSIRNRILNDSYGGAQKHISQGYVKDICVPLPPLPTQQKIAAILDQADALRKKDQLLLAKYDELLHSVFYDMFGDPVKNEKGWEVKRIGDVFKVETGSTPSRANVDFFKGNIPWIKTGEVLGEEIFSSEEKISTEAIKNSNCKILPVNTILIAMYGQGLTRGRVGLLRIKATTNQACAAILPNESNSQDYVFHLLKSLYSQIRDLGRGGNQPNLNLSLVRNIEIILPPKKLQNEFSKKAENIQQQKEQAKQQLQQSEALFRSLLQRSFKGELV